MTKRADDALEAPKKLSQRKCCTHVIISFREMKMRMSAAENASNGSWADQPLNCRLQDTPG